MPDDTSPDAINLYRTMTRHLMFLKQGMRRIVHAVEDRMDVHDASKFSPEEFDGFVQINKVARDHKYGSPEYTASLKSVDAVPRHFKNNDHHPEFHNKPSSEMGFLAIIEMVCDWRAAWKSYNAEKAPEDRQLWSASMITQGERFAPTSPHGLSLNQWWLVGQVASFLEEMDRAAEGFPSISPIPRQ